MPKAKFLSKEDCLRAMKNTKSNRAAARFLRCSFVHYKKYARTYTNEEGISLWEAHKNQSGVGIPKWLPNMGMKAPLKDLIAGIIPVESFSPTKIKHRLIEEGYLVEKCSRCGFCEPRANDWKIPLILQFKNKDKKNYSLDNIELMCYNCSFLYSVSPITDEQVQAAEDFVDRQHQDIDWELDDFMKEHLSDLGLLPEESKPSNGSEFISENYKKNVK